MEVSKQKLIFANQSILWSDRLLDFYNHFRYLIDFLDETHLREGNRRNTQDEEMRRVSNRYGVYSEIANLMLRSESGFFAITGSIQCRNQCDWDEGTQNESSVLENLNQLMHNKATDLKYRL